MSYYQDKYGKAYGGLASAMKPAMTPQYKQPKMMSDDEMRRIALMRSIGAAAPGVLGAAGTVAGGLIGGVAGGGAFSVPAAALGAGIGGAAGTALGGIAGTGLEAYAQNEEMPYQRSAMAEQGRRSDDDARRQAIMQQIAMMQAMRR